MRKASFLSPDFPIQECHLKECKNVTASWCVFHVECPKCAQNCNCYLLWWNLAMNLFFNYEECTCYILKGSKHDDARLWNSHLLGSQFGVSVSCRIKRDSHLVLHLIK